VSKDIGKRVSKKERRGTGGLEYSQDEAGDSLGTWAEGKEKGSPQGKKSSG